ncbi:hypothetical protein [Sporichthya sp.]|uniref:hypothetical protein n=1 Tax=Sporichthya sp. TaxID=65475 RepID=UPI0017BFB85B|nr:hypothetical protein [Sporichthya sp.]MBA3743478.1 hypothetical protein [Sporichthya sp.]
MSFIQIIDSRTTKFEEMSALDEQYEKDTAGRGTYRRSITCRDRNDPDRYLVMVFFDSYEDAMRNSELPETQALAEKMGALVDGPPSFIDLDILEDKAF